ncbi:MAG: hypothetical protein K2X81_13420 [Candidatus Obscuribacterales bacterium]|nr:hypothetical protein [Candidatus Obscuribacterales bacterium]
MKTTNLLLAILIAVLAWVGWPKPTKTRSPELMEIRVQEAAKIVQLHEIRIQDVKLDIEKEEAILAYYQERADRLKALSKTGSVPAKDFSLALHELSLAKIKVRSSAIDLQDAEIELELTKIRLRAAAIDPDDVTIYVERAKR